MTDVLDPVLTDITLQTHITGAQRLLHDSTYKFYTQAELTDYANEARNKVAAETGCNAQIVQAWSLDQGVNAIPLINNILPGRRVIGLLDVYLWMSANYRPPLRYYPYSIFSRSSVVAYNYQGVPEMWTQRGGQVFIARIPGQNYTLDFDAAVEPTPLVNLDDVDNEVSAPFAYLVKYVMCYLAKLKDHKYDEAERYMQIYVRERNMLSSSTNIRKLVGQ